MLQPLTLESWPQSQTLHKDDRKNLTLKLKKEQGILRNEYRLDSPIAHKGLEQSYITNQFFL
jgi:hypothetical protein